MGDEARAPAVAGQFYAADGAALAHQVERCFTDARGPGALPSRHRRDHRGLVAGIVPHAGLPYSGAIAAHLYARVAAERPPRAVVVLGVDHQGAGPGPTLSARPWRTPLGPTAVDNRLVQQLAGIPIPVDESAQAHEHSIEVQLPFLEYVLPRPAFVPLQIPFASFAELESLGHGIAERLRGEDVLLLASTDFSHYVAPAVAERMDRLAIDAILAGDARALYRVVAEERISMCGIAPTTVLLAALEGRPLTRTLLRWGHSGEVEPMAEVVGYAAVSLAEPASPPAPVK